MWKESVGYCILKKKLCLPKSLLYVTQVTFNAFYISLLSLGQNAAYLQWPWSTGDYCSKKDRPWPSAFRLASDPNLSWGSPCHVTLNLKKENSFTETSSIIFKSGFNNLIELAKVPPGCFLCYLMFLFYGCCNMPLFQKGNIDILFVLVFVFNILVLLWKLKRKHLRLKALWSHWLIHSL